MSKEIEKNTYRQKRFVTFCEMCKFAHIEVHDPKRTGEESYDPHYSCYRNQKQIIERVHADDFCSRGVIKEQYYRKPYESEERA